ncbi:MAG: aldehyde dehydrogenase family protein, partial [Desulfatitalea sp.]|nr:aldehyde dehydrogenase family protein [Desulfatitalea sp.]
MTLLRSHNPATGEMIWTGRSAKPAEVAAAVAKARKAFDPWHRRPLSARRAVIEQFGRVLEREKAHLTETIARETGKVRWDARGEVTAMIAKTAIAVQAQQERAGRRENISGDLRNVVRHRPHGVVAVLGPYNFPGHLPNGHILPALLAGNTVIFKPSELTPWVAEQTLACWRKAGLPDGVLQVVQGGG